MTPISKELQEQIEREADAYCCKIHRAIEAESWKAYNAGATAYAHYKERWEQAKKALEDMLAGYDALSAYQKDWFRVKSALIQDYKALASWKEEGKGGNNG